MENLRPKKLYSTARRIFCCKKRKKTLDDIIGNVWKLDLLDEDNVEPIDVPGKYIEPFQIKGQYCWVHLSQPTMGYRCSMSCARVYYELETGYIARTGQAKDVHASSKFPEEQFSQVRLLLELLLRFSQQRTIARMQFFSFETDENQREFLFQRIAEFDEVAALNLPKIPVKKLLLSGCDRNFGMERFFEYEYLSLYRGTQLYPELNTAKFLVVSDKQDEPEEIKKFRGWGLAVMEAEQNHFSPEILKDQVTEWLESGNCQYKFLCILDEKQEIIEDNIIKWALSLIGEPVQRSCGNDNANLKKRLVHGKEEGILYIFERNCIVFMRGDAICDDFAQLAEFGAPYPGSHTFFGPKDAFQKIVPFTEEMLS